jgi:hypothetical protein
MLAYFGRRYVNLLRTAGFAWHLYPETASKPHLSNEIGRAIILASQRMECFVRKFLKITDCTRSEQMIILPKGDIRRDQTIRDALKKAQAALCQYLEPEAPMRIRPSSSSSAS